MQTSVMIRSVDQLTMISTFEMIVILLVVAKLTVNVSWDFPFPAIVERAEFTTRRYTNVLSPMSWRPVMHQHQSSSAQRNPMTAP